MKVASKMERSCMNDLTNLQDKFQSYLLHGDEQIENLIVGTKNVPVALRLEIYGNAYRERLLEALESTYTALKVYLGDDEFYQLGYEYIDAHPSTFRSIRWFGDLLADFLKNHENYADYPFLSELALIEWTMSLTFDAADSKVITENDINRLPPDAWETMKIQFVPSLHQIQLSWNVFEIWQKISDEEDPPEPLCSAAPVNWVMWRNDLLNHFSSIAEDQAFAMKAAQEGNSFSTICEGLCQWMSEEDAVMRAVLLFKEWVVSGMVQGLIIEKEFCHVE
jgi:hypothetical protein